MLPVNNDSTSLSVKLERGKSFSPLSMLMGVHDIKDIYRQINNNKRVTIVIN